MKTKSKIATLFTVAILLVIVSLRISAHDQYKIDLPEEINQVSADSTKPTVLCGFKKGHIIHIHFKPLK